MSELLDKLNMPLPPDASARLIHFVTDYLNRGYQPRAAVLAAFKALGDSYGSMGISGEMRVSEEAIEKTVTYFEQAVERYRAQEAAGAKPVVDGLYAQVVDDDEFEKQTK
jgi:hypothetical protein